MRAGKGTTLAGGNGDRKEDEKWCTCCGGGGKEGKEDYCCTCRRGEEGQHFGCPLADGMLTVKTDQVHYRLTALSPPTPLPMSAHPQPSPCPFLASYVPIFPANMGWYTIVGGMMVEMAIVERDGMGEGGSCDGW